MARTARSTTAAWYYARRRALAHADPKLGLAGTHTFRAADSGFDVGDAFPNRARAITVAVKVKRTASTARGIIIEFGNGTTGMALWIAGNNEDIVACAGDVGAGGVTSTASNVLQTDGQTASVVFSVIPGSGEFRLWVNGKLRDRDAAATTPLPNGWAADSAGGIGEVSGTASDRIPAGDKITLVGAAMISPVTVYDGQRPRHFNAGVTSVVSILGAILTESGDFLTTEVGDHLIAE